MMEAGKACSEMVLQLPWCPVNIGGRQLLAKSYFGEAEYHILLTDLLCVWEERMDTVAIQTRAEELNRRLRAPVKAFFSHLCQVVQPSLTGSEAHSQSGQAQMSVSRQQDGGMDLKLKSELAGLPFYWEFHCTAAPVTTACVQLVRPLLAMSHLLQRQSEQLGALLSRKDAEIQDYRENGATLSRERLKTDVFDEQTWGEDFMTKTVPLLTSDHPGSLSFDGGLQQLYAAVVAQGNAPKRKRQPSDEEEPSPEQPHLTPSLGEAGEQSQDSQADAPGAPAASKPTVQQSLPTTSAPAERPSSKPKKKKVVGLFR